MSEYCFNKFHCLNKGGTIVLNMIKKSSDYGHTVYYTFLKNKNGSFYYAQHTAYPDICCSNNDIQSNEKLNHCLLMAPTYSSIMQRLQRI